MGEVINTLDHGNFEGKSLDDLVEESRIEPPAVKPFVPPQTTPVPPKPPVVVPPPVVKPVVKPPFVLPGSFTQPAVKAGVSANPEKVKQRQKDLAEALKQK